MAAPPHPKLVRDIMTVGVPTCSTDTPIVDIANKMVQEDFEALVVMEDGNALGVVTQDDLINSYTRGNVRSLVAIDIMQEGIHQIPADIPLEVAAQIMQDKGVRALFLTHHAGGITYPAAIITYQHILRFLAARDDDDIRDLGIKAERESPLDAFIKRRDEAKRKRISKVS
jgi:predicted transcriptional regulator